MSDDDLSWLARLDSSPEESPVEPVSEEPFAQEMGHAVSSKAKAIDGPFIAILAVSLLLICSVVLAVFLINDYDPDDLDNDGVENNGDDCPDGLSDWLSDANTDHDGDGCQDLNEDENDDNDSLLDDADLCPTGLLDWVSSLDNDADGDGCQDASEDSDDDNDGVEDVNDTFPLDPTEWLDSDMDGVGDNNDAFPFDPAEYLDSDADGYGDGIDLFPFNGTEWSDADGDGTGDNADLDDDNDGVFDEEDLNDRRDGALYLTLDSFTLHETVDLFDTQGEIYFCVSVNNDSLGCLPSVLSSYEEVDVGQTISLSHSYFINLDERLRYHYIEVSAFDSDPFSDDLLDINPSEDEQSFIVYFDAQDGFFNQSIVGNGTDGGSGDAGTLEFSLLPFDNLVTTVRQFTWDFEGVEHSLVWALNYSSYISYRSMNHYIDWSFAETYQDIIPQYAAFATPNDPHIMALAEELEHMANEFGYTSQLDVARFIHAFVGDIPYMFDDDSVANQSEYPKYPMEMLWEEAGDCEDASVLYISLAEHLGYDTALMLGQTKSNEDDDWGGHAWAVVVIDNYSGDSYMGAGQKSNLSYYFVETTAHEGSIDIGVNPWYDITDEAFYEIT
jgi:hypothetical protein